MRLRTWVCPAVSRSRLLLGLGPVALSLTTASYPLTAQTPTELKQEREEFAAWLAASPISPLAAVAQQPVGPGVTLGPEGADIPIPGVPDARVTEEKGTLFLSGGKERARLARGRQARLGTHTLLAVGRAGRTILAVYGPTRAHTVPAYYPYDPELVITAPLEAPEHRGRFRTLAIDGIETDAVEAGFFPVRLDGGHTRLRVYQIPDPETGALDLTIYFRDQTNGKGSYPAGRFVNLQPTAEGQYRLDFNRARNPFCAYSTVYPCPAPWPGNTIPAELRVGEKYGG